MTKCIHVFCDDTATHQYLDHPVCYDCWYRQMAFYVYEKPWNMLTKEETEDCNNQIDDIYKYWGRPEKTDKLGLPVYVATKKKDTEKPPYFCKRYLCKDLKICKNKHVKNKDFQKQLHENNNILQYFDY